MKEFKGNAIYNPSGKAGEYSYWACNFYIGCSNGCTYCFNKKGRSAKLLGGDSATLKKSFKDNNNALEIFEKELLQNLPEIKKSGLFFSFTTDPMITETMSLTLHSILICQRYNVPVKILTKETRFINLLLYPSLDRSLVAVGFTLTGHDNLEPNASTNSDRIAAMDAMSQEGFKTFASIEPIIDFKSSQEMIEQVSGFCDLIKVGLESGGKYNLKESYEFMSFLINLKKPKIYIKESLRKLVSYDDFDDEFFVERDYNLFTKNKGVSSDC